MKPTIFGLSVHYNFDKLLLQRYTMAVFYYSARGNRWLNCSAPINYEDEEQILEANNNCTINTPGSDHNDAWLTPVSECRWGGLACDRSDRVIRIDFEQNGVAGTTPSELSALANLQYLLLEEGALFGEIPSELSELEFLVELDLNFNLLEGTIPEIFFETLTNLQTLDLNDNELFGTISTQIGNMKALTFFQIEENEFTGTIPTELGSLKLLEVATMNGNQLQGEMPAEVCANTTGTINVLTVDCLGAPMRPSPPLVIL